MTIAHDAPDTAKPPPTRWWTRLWEDSVSTALKIAAIFRRNPEWIVIVFAWMAAAFVPVFWFMGEDHWWVESGSALFFEPFVLLLAAALLWQDRQRLLEAYQMTPRHKRHGSPWVLWLGCLVILGSHLIHVLTVAAIGLIIVATGIVYMAYGGFVLKQASRALIFAILFIPPPVKPVTTVASLLSVSAWTKITSALQKLGTDISCTAGASGATLVSRGHVIEVPNQHLPAIIFTGVLALFLCVWRRDRVGTALLTMAFGGLVAGILSVMIPFTALLLPISPVADALVRISPIAITVLAFGLTVLVRNRLGLWLNAFAERSRVIGKISADAQKATDRATAGIAVRVGSGTGKASQGMTKGTEALIDKLIAVISKPFKRKKRNRW